jgi:hypothetical protein
MAHISKDRVKETTTTTGTGAIALAGAVTGYRAFSFYMTVGVDTCYYLMVGGAGEWEMGLGTYSSANTLTRTTVYRSSNSDAAVTFSSGTKEVYLIVPADDLPIFQPDNSIIMPPADPEPAAPTSSPKLYIGRNASRDMLKISTVTDGSTTMQPFLSDRSFVMFKPNTGTIGTGAGGGPLWTSNGTVTHPTPSSTAPAISNQMKRTRYANVVTTQNQQLGPRMNVASEQQFWRGNAAGTGGFYFHTRFVVDLWPAATVRIFAGLTASATGSVCTSNTVLNDTCGLWHDTADAATTFNFVTRNTTTTTKQAITLSNAIAAGNSYDFWMFCAQNGSTIFWKLYDIRYGVTYSNSTSTTLPTATAFMQPQVQMSNGTANTTVTTSAIGVCSIYAESLY